jgi:hypothetical protein
LELEGREAAGAGHSRLITLKRPLRCSPDAYQEIGVAVEIKAGEEEGPVRVIRLRGRVQIWGGTHFQ